MLGEALASKVIGKQGDSTRLRNARGDQPSTSHSLSRPQPTAHEVQAALMRGTCDAWTHQSAGTGSRSSGSNILKRHHLDSAKVFTITRWLDDEERAWPSKLTGEYLIPTEVQDWLRRSSISLPATNYAAMSFFKDLYALYSPKERRNIGIYIIGIMLYKFGLESVRKSSSNFNILTLPRSSMVPLRLSPPIASKPRMPSPKSVCCKD